MLSKGFKIFLDLGFCFDMKQMFFIIEREIRNCIFNYLFLLLLLYGYKVEFGCDGEEKGRSMKKFNF